MRRWAGGWGAARQKGLAFLAQRYADSVVCRGAGGDAHGYGGGEEELLREGLEEIHAQDVTV
jgi:hypothetical protein